VVKYPDHFWQANCWGSNAASLLCASTVHRKWESQSTPIAGVWPINLGCSASKRIYVDQDVWEPLFEPCPVIVPCCWAEIAKYSSCRHSSCTCIYFVPPIAGIKQWSCCCFPCSCPLPSREKAHIRYFCVICSFEISQEDEYRCVGELQTPVTWLVLPHSLE
jgi:hypothetical protein